MAAKKLSGLKLNEAYTITNQIGSGLTCIAYECTGGDCPVALKVMRSPEYSNALARETRVAGILANASPYIVNYIDFGTLYLIQDGSEQILSWIMMEKLNHSLSGYLRKVIKIPIVDAFKMISGIFAGLSTLHSAGIIHTDIKPSNIMFRGSAGIGGVPVLVDLGTAAVGPTSDGRGTVMYNSPEMIFFGKCGPAADVWATMAIMFELVTGDILFDAYMDYTITYGGGLDEQTGSTDGDSSGDYSSGSSGDYSGSSDDTSSGEASGIDDSFSGSESDSEEDSDAELQLDQRLVRLWWRVLGKLPQSFIKSSAADDLVDTYMPEIISLHELIAQNYDLDNATVDQLVSFVERGLTYNPVARISAEDAKVLAQRCFTIAN